MAYIKRKKAIKRKVVRRVKKAAPRYKQVSLRNNIPRMQKFRWVSNFTLDPPVGNPMAVHRFACNDCTKPDVSGVVLHYPLRWTHMRNYYQEYLVIGAKITVTRINTQNTTVDGIPQVWGMYLDNNTTLISPTYQTLMEQGRGKHLVTNSHSTYGGQKLSMGFSTKKYFNLHDLKDNWQQFGAETSASPNKKAYWVVYAQCVVPDIDIVLAHYMVSIDYAVIFAKPKEVLN